jgi:peptide/nickel transport system substrate-binding protein
MLSFIENIRKDAPQAQCTMRESGVSTNLIINAEAPPFNDPRIRRALALTLDRKSLIDILSEGEDKMAGIMLPPPDGALGDDAGDDEGPAGLRRRREGARGPAS